jgi:hypothetical protein
MFAVLRKLRSNEAIRGIIDIESAQHEKIDGSHIIGAICGIIL